MIASALVTVGWAALVWTGSIDTIWPMFGIANQLLAVLALALVTTWLINTGRRRYAAVTVLPMLFVTATTMTAGAQMVGVQFPATLLREVDAAGEPMPGPQNGDKPTVLSFDVAFTERSLAVGERVQRRLSRASSSGGGADEGWTSASWPVLGPERRTMLGMGPLGVGGAVAAVIGDGAGAGGGAGSGFVGADILEREAD